MKILITGASGFLGRYVVAAAVQHGHCVCAVVRSKRHCELLPWANHPAIEMLEADLAQPNTLESIPKDINAVIHLVASKSSNLNEARLGTVVTTQHLLQAMEKVQISRLILISSFSVYDYAHCPSDSVLDETCAVDQALGHRDAYAQTKIEQERVVHTFAAQHPDTVTILRPGIIFGHGMLWNACHGINISPLWIQVGGHAIMPLTYVENCAEAIIRAVEVQKSKGQILNIIDDHLPSRKAYTEALIRMTDSPPLVIPMSWTLLRGIAHIAQNLNNTLTQDRLKLPGILTPAQLEARLKPLTYSNQRAKDCLDWSPRYDWNEGLRRAHFSPSFLLSV